MGIGIALAGVAVAAGLFFFLRPKPVEQRAPTAERAATAQVDEAEPTGSAAVAAPAKTAERADGAIDIGALTDATASPDSTGVAPDPGAVAQHDPSKPAPIVKVEPDGTLHDAMEKVTGPVEEKNDATPAAADTQPKNLPDRPAQGSVTAAVGSVMGGARACVAGGEDVSRATITFGSSGAVKSVAVSGWASGKPAASCIQSAMKGANVGPFSQPTFTFGVTVRP